MLFFVFFGGGGLGENICTNIYGEKGGRKKERRKEEGKEEKRERKIGRERNGMRCDDGQKTMICRQVYKTISW